MAQPQLTPLPFRIGIFAIALFWGLVTLGSILVAMVKNGPRKYFYKKKRDKRPACLDDPSLGTHSFIRLEDVRLHFVQSGPEGKPLLLFFHGFPEFWYSWRHQLREFNKEYRCVAVDMRGYGESDKPMGVENYSLDKLADDVRQLILALGYEKCILVAHDWGGFVTQYFAFLHPNMVERLVLCNIPHPLLLKPAMLGYRQFLMSWYIFFFQLPWLPESLLSSNDTAYLNRVLKDAGDADDVDAYKWSMQQPGGITNPLNYYRALLKYQIGPLPRQRIEVPTLMVWGVNDQALSTELAGKTGFFYKDYTINFIESSGHWVQIEAATETNVSIRKFLARN